MSILAFEPSCSFGQVLKGDELKNFTANAKETIVEVEFGIVLVGESAKKQVSIKNPFGSNLKIIAIEKSCSCTAGLLKSSDVKNGEDIELEAHFSVGGKPGLFRKDVLVYCKGDNKDYLLRLQFVANVHSHVEITSANWHVDPEQIDNSLLTVRVLNFFESGMAPDVWLDGFERVKATQTDTTKIEKDLGVCAVWEATFSAPSTWVEVDKIPQLKQITVTQAFTVGVKRAERDISVKIRKLLVARPKTIVLRGDKQRVQIEIIVFLSEWSEDDLVAKATKGGCKLPFEILVSTNNSVLLRFEKRTLDELLAGETSISVGFENKNVFCKLEILR